MKKQKIIHIEDFFHPDAGYQVNILAKYLTTVNYEVFIVTAELSKIPGYLTDFFGKDDIEERDRAYADKYGVKIIRLPLRAYISGRAIYSTRQLQKVIREIDPDILYVHGCDTYAGMQVIRKAEKISCKIITDNHMVDVASENPFRSFFRIYYRKWITPHIIKNRIPVLRMVDDLYVKKRLGIPLELAPVISFGTDTMLFHPSQNEKRRIREIYGIPENARVFCYAGKLDEHKGGKFLAEALLKKMPVESELVFLLIGNSSGEYGEEVEGLLAGSENRIIRLPTQKYEELSKYYQCADVAMFPLGCSLSFFDVQACGLPVISEAMEINVERCSHENGMNYERGDIEDFRNKICAMAQLSDEELGVMSENSVRFISNRYNYADILKEYLAVFDRLNPNDEGNG